MKTLKTSNITSGASMPIKSGTLDFVQNAWKEISRNLANAIGSNVHEIAGSGTVLWGCEDSGGGFPNYNIRSGLVYYGGELYLLTGAAFTAPIGKVAVCTITTSYDTSATTDPVLFTDGNSYNVHEIKVMTVAAGNAGTGTVDYSALTFINPAHNEKTQGSFHANWSGSSLKYRRNAHGLIHLTGKLEAGASASYSDAICTLPSGWRPAADMVFSTTRFDGITLEPARVIVKTNGQVFIDNVNGGVAVNDSYIMNGISFYKSF